jgi:predicted nucleic acid-binding protein
MVLVDTSVWVTHFRSGSSRLKSLLADGKVACHSFIVGELACGRLQNRVEILSLLQTLPAAIQAEHEEVLHLIQTHRLMGLGLGCVDVHLLASSLLSGIPLWTEDKQLRKAALKLEVCFKQEG